MQSIQFSKLILAFLVIASFSSVGISIAYRNGWLAFLFIVIGFLIMGVGLSLKRKQARHGESNMS
ncbi:DUF5325 family protein [Aquibacillus albus]|uniref:Phage infection (PIP) family protein YhgE n=1 Tax=Aquibacillus albus TaxID=1168171 RepID=A0ABS2N2C0_9BACI|nr:DUF5325 family protein [Aquibacillus albus]MBM7572236.1 putative phage infection (PIP) family protein YhgE [Aquibacillus albus]